MPNRIVSTEELDPDRKIPMNELLEQLEIALAPQPLDMARAINVDVDELKATIYNMAKKQRMSPLKTQLATLLGVISWGVAIGYTYAKRETPIIKPS